MEDIQYALDIGTRSVTGLLYRLHDGVCDVIAAHNIEHTNRAMQDGQIHDIDEVARVIKTVTAHLENSAGISLRQVAVAAAGRALQTVQAEAVIPLLDMAFTEADVFNLQLVALQEAQHALAEKSGDCNQHGMTMHCVGYSVRDYFLDDSRIGSLVGQRGREARVAIIATFLPRVVIDSLDSALTRAGLTMQGLTLEPIAALNALVPTSMRKLNIALVDIGAGTSDIAITAEGTILAYGMVPIAGDEITEAIAEQLLLDFPTAENLKRELATGTRHTFSDILGNRHTLTTKKVVGELQTSIAALASAIGAEIVHQNNGKIPAAVMVIGGGARTPLIEQAIAQTLGLANDRVRMRGRESIQNVRGCEDVLAGSEAVTPIGIALASAYSEITPLTVQVSGRSTRLFAFHPLTVGDALLEAGVDVRELKPRAGSAIVVEVNGRVKSLPGTLGTPGSVLCNGKTVALADVLSAGDTVEVIRAADGSHARGTIQDVLPDLRPMRMRINDTVYSFEPVIYSNDRLVQPETAIKDRDIIRVEGITVTAAVEQCLGVTLQSTTSAMVNGRSITLYQRHYTIFPPVEAQTLIHDGMTIRVDAVFSLPLCIQDAIAAAGISTAPGVVIQFNGHERSLLSSSAIQRNGTPCRETDPLADGDVIECTDSSRGEKTAGLTMSSVILHLGDGLKLQATGKERLVLRRNGLDADFTTPVFHGDVVEIYWENNKT